jgi:hypothetical protein
VGASTFILTIELEWDVVGSTTRITGGVCGSVEGYPDKKTASAKLALGWRPYQDCGSLLQLRHEPDEHADVPKQDKFMLESIHQPHTPSDRGRGKASEASRRSLDCAYLTNRVIGFSIVGTPTIV